MPKTALRAHTRRGRAAVIPPLTDDHPIFRLAGSSAILALLDADDADHEPAVAIARRIASERRPGFITNYIEVEAHALSCGSSAAPSPASGS